MAVRVELGVRVMLEEVCNSGRALRFLELALFVSGLWIEISLQLLLQRQVYLPAVIFPTAIVMHAHTFGHISSE